MSFQNNSFTSTLYFIWMLLSVVGFPVTVGWLLYRAFRLRLAVTEQERSKQREKIRNAAIVMGVFLLILIGFIVYSAAVFGESASPLPTEVTAT